MGNTTNALVELGKKQIRDSLKEFLSSNGIQEAVSFELKLTNGETIVIASDSNPALNRPASEVADGGIRVRQSASAGVGISIEQL